MPKYYRVTYDNIGIYEALKRKVDFVEWRNILNQSTWLPKPPMYDDTCVSYFTEIGYKKFNTNTMPIVIKYLDKDKINIEEVTELIGDILYRDKYQVVVRQVISESLSPSKVKLSKDDFDENMHFIKTHAKTPKDLNTILSKFDYGYFTKDGTYYDENNTGDFSDYTTMDPRDVIKFAVGVCWDFAETEAYLFDKLFNYKITNKALKNSTYSLYYMEHDDSKGMSPTHTWLAYMKNDKVYLFESSWLKHQGIHEFNSEMEMIEFYDKSQRENEVKKGNKLRGGIVIKYLPVRRYGLKPLEFMTHIYKCNTSRLMKVSPEFPIHCNIKPIKEDTDMVFNEELEKGNNVIFSEDDIYCNMDKWDNHESHVLFILGLSASGKSTLSRKLAEKYKCNLIELDVIAFAITGEKAHDKGRQTWEYIKKADHMLYKFMKEKGLEPDFMRHVEATSKQRPLLDKKDEREKQRWVDKYIHWVCFEQKERCVLEGGHACVTIANHKEYRDFPIIFKGSSLLKSMIRRVKRTWIDDNKPMGPIELAKYLVILYKQYGKMFPEVNAARDAVITKDNFKIIKESITSITQSIARKYDKVYFIKCKWEDGDKSGYTVNACKNINGEVYRVRTEMLVIKDGKVLCVKDYHDNLGLGYKLPGGSVEKGVSYAEQAAEEVKEEARIIINPKSILDTGITYIRKYTKQPRWVSHLTPPIPYVGGISYVYVGEYKSDFNGDIPDVHRDDGFYKRARFYDIDEIKWIPEHKKALDMYLEKNMQKQDQSKDTYENALKIFNSLTPQEQYWMDDRYVNSPHTFYRKVHFIGRKPVGFVDTYRFHPNDPAVVIVLAVNKSYRGKGIAINLVKSATLYCKSKGIKKIIWRAHKDNYASIQLAKKLGYTKTKEDEKSYRFEKTL